MGHGGAEADLREGPHGWGGSCKDTEARSSATGPVSRGVQTPRLPANADRLQGEKGHAWVERPRGDCPLCARQKVARGRKNLTLGARKNGTEVPVLGKASQFLR